MMNEPSAVKVFVSSHGNHVSYDLGARSAAECIGTVLVFSSAVLSSDVVTRKVRGERRG